MPKPVGDDEKDIVVDEEQGRGGEGDEAMKAKILEYWSHILGVWVV